VVGLERRADDLIRDQGRQRGRTGLLANHSDARCAPTEKDMLDYTSSRSKAHPARSEHLRQIKILICCSFIFAEPFFVGEVA
jgi:hypothetical protein